jgi:hypothetical protein
VPGLPLPLLAVVLPFDTADTGLAVAAVSIDPSTPGLRVERGDTSVIAADLLNTHGPANLSGCVVSFSMRRVQSRPSDRATVTGAAQSVGDPRQGRVAYAWKAGQTDVPGDYRVEWQVLLPNGRRRTYPPDGYQALRILPSLE